jgi:hypothetical protein
VRDWSALVRERLPEAGLPAAQREEIIAELAGHLEEFYEEQRTEGLSEAEALDHALGQVANWRDLSRKIERAKRTEGKMNQRTRSFWVPAFITLTAWVLFEAILAQTSYGPRMILGHPKLMDFIWPIWLAGQPFLGAIGAYTSRRAGGTRVARLAAGLFPMVITLVGMVAGYVLILIAWMYGRIDLGHIDLVSAERLALGIIILPGLALLLGTLPFLKSPNVKALAGS